MTDTLSNEQTRADFIGDVKLIVHDLYVKKRPEKFNENEDHCWKITVKSLLTDTPKRRGHLIVAPRVSAYGTFECTD